MKNYFNTIKYLRNIQIYYRIWYQVRLLFRRIFFIKYKLLIPKKAYPLKLDLVSLEYIKKENNTFTFINQSKEFNNIDWDYSKYGKLWIYNLNYMDYLLQSDMDFKDGKELILDYISNYNQSKVGKEPYTISLRSINWIKFISNHRKEFEINRENYNHINASLYAQYQILLNNLEYHLLGNHLLENAFSLLFGSYYFQCDILYHNSKKIILNELEEQILKDGAHFELSPMYHCIILGRLLESIDLIRKNDYKSKEELLDVLIKQSEKMLSWLATIQYSGKQLPHVNDSTLGVAPNPDIIFNYAESLNLNWKKIKLSDSGYRKFCNEQVELFIDIGNIGPEYLPGHAHSDTFSFELYYKNSPYIVDTGISTYNNNKHRFFERSTYAHNTITINGMSQSKMWDVFRVADRAKVVNLIESDNIVKASHTGYKSLGLLHTRKFNVKENIIISDTVRNSNRYKIESCLHFHPDREVILDNNTIFIDKKIKLELINYSNIQIKEYEYCAGFNKRIKAKKMLALVSESSEIRILYEN